MSLRLGRDVESTVTRRLVRYSLGEVDREVTIPVGEGIRVIVERHLESCTFEPGDRASKIGDLEDQLEPRDQPGARHQLQLAVPLPIQSGEAVVADRHVGMRAQSHPPIH